MKAFTSHDTALQYWRFHFPLDGELGEPTSISHAESYAHRKADVLGCIPETYRPEEKPLDVLVYDARCRAWSKDLNCHVWSTPVPPGAFYRVHDMYVSSPEFVFLQMASSLTIAQLVALGCELCGTYVLVPRSKRLTSELADAPRRNEPLTNTKKLAAFLDAATGAHHLVKARRALRYIVEGSRSPMETLTALKLSLPALLGGYGLPKPTMNLVIPLDDEARRISNRHWCEGDLCWPGPDLDVEYNGDVHSGTEKIRDDAGRILGIEHMGWKVVTVTFPQVIDIDRFEIVAKEAAKHLRRRLQPRTLGHTPSRMGLNAELEAWMEIG